MADKTETETPAKPYYVFVRTKSDFEAIRYERAHFNLGHAGDLLVFQDDGAACKAYAAGQWLEATMVQADA